jgi:hypothetical protein
MPTDALISQSLDSLINGVSRQPAHQRLVSQHENQENILSDVADGVVRRPPTEHIAVLEVAPGGMGFPAKMGGMPGGAQPPGGYATHIFENSGITYICYISDGDVNVYNADTGAEITVNDGTTAGVEGAYDYLDYGPLLAGSPNAEDTFDLITVADYTFITNKSITASKSGTTAAGRTHAHEFFLVVTGSGGLTSTNQIDMTFDGAAIGSGVPGNTSTEAMMGALCLQLASTTAPSDTTGTHANALNWKFTRTGNLLHGYQFQNALEAVTSSDRFGDSISTFATTGVDGEDPEIRSFSELPVDGINGFSVKVTGSGGTKESTYYLTFDGKRGVWVETAQVGLDNNFDVDTMPHALVKTIPGHPAPGFTFQPNTWTARQAGDADSALDPSFIGNTIEAVTFHKGRLMLVSGENVIASERGDLFNFYPTTVSTIVDSDPVDVAGTGNVVSTWDYMVPYGSGLTLFSSEGDTISEMVGSRDGQLSIKNARIEQRAEYPFSAVRPVATADAIFFIHDQGGSTMLQRYSTADGITFRADDVTSHVSTYVPAGVFKIAGGRAKNIIALLSSAAGEEHRVYVYRYHYSGADQVMASWSRWSFAPNDEILSANWHESVLYLTIQRADGPHLEKIDFGKTDEDAGVGATPLGYRVHLDSLNTSTGVYDAVTDETQFDTGYEQDNIGGTYSVVKGGAWGSDRGQTIPILDQTPLDYVIVAGDQTAHDVYVGREYESELPLSEIHVRGSSSYARGGGSASSVRASGRLQLRKGYFKYSDTGTFCVDIESEEDTEVYGEQFTSQFINQAILGATGLDSGTFAFDIGGDSRNVRIIVRSSSFLPFKLSAFDWEGRYYNRSRQA